MCRRRQLHIRISARKLVQERSHIRRSLASRLLVNEQHRSRSTLGRRHHPTHSAGGTVRLPTRPTLNVIVSCDVCCGPLGRVPIERAATHNGLTCVPGSSRSARFSTQAGGGNQGINMRNQLITMAISSVPFNRDLSAERVPGAEHDVPHPRIAVAVPHFHMVRVFFFGAEPGSRPFIEPRTSEAHELVPFSLTPAGHLPARPDLARPHQDDDCDDRDGQL
jgi:hypothetical protein